MGRDDVGKLYAEVLECVGVLRDACERVLSECGELEFSDSDYRVLLSLCELCALDSRFRSCRCSFLEAYITYFGDVVGKG